MKAFIHHDLMAMITQSIAIQGMQSLDSKPLLHKVSRRLMEKSQRPWAARVWQNGARVLPRKLFPTGRSTLEPWHNQNFFSGVSLDIRRTLNLIASAVNTNQQKGKDQNEHH
jgi:hypothetical protein